MDDVAITSCTGGTLPTTDELVTLYDAVGWQAYTREPDSLARGVQGSLHVVTARRDGRLVGLARIVGDGATICYLQDVLVHPDARRLGVGSRLVEAVFSPYAQVRQQVLVTDDEPGQKAFYEALGFLDYAATFSGRTFVRFAR